MERATGETDVNCWEEADAPEALQRYRTLVNTVDDGIYQLDREGRFIAVNDTVVELTGYAREELLGEPASLLLDEDDVERIGRAVQRRLSSDEMDAEAIEFTARGADGEEIVCELQLSLLLDGEASETPREGGKTADGHFQGTVGVVRDITDRKRTEQRLKERERALRAHRDSLEAELEEVYGRVTDAFYALDDRWRFTYVNERAAELLGVTEEELLGSDFWETFPEATAADEARESLRTAMEEQEATTFEAFSALLGFWIEAGIYPSETGLSVYFNDITERKEYQRQLEKTNERLERFAYAASHDLQEPLRMVSSYLQMIENRYGDEFDEEGREFLAFAVDGADRMREMIDGLLEYSRVQTQANPFEPVELADVLADVRDDLRVKIEEHDAAIVTEDLPRIEGDPSQIRQVLQNLIDNAIEYSGEGPPRIRVAAERDGAECVVSVRDNGIGIDPDETDRIFDVFERLHSRDEHSGTGIGLALCERVVERHGGEIWVESEPEDGTTFSFTLPVATDRDT